MSAFGGKAGSLSHLSECLLIATSGTCDIQLPRRESGSWEVLAIPPEALGVWELCRSIGADDTTQQPEVRRRLTPGLAEHLQQELLALRRQLDGLSITAR